jgi:flagellar biosynthesis/type III secretory pathway protein FliH
MAKLTINVGSAVNAKDGDTVRDAFNKVNQNFTELYVLAGQGSAAELEELAQDYAAAMFTNGTHSGITATYEDADNKLNLTISIDGGNAATTY